MNKNVGQNWTRSKKKLIFRDLKRKDLKFREILIRNPKLYFNSGPLKQQQNRAA